MIDVTNLRCDVPDYDTPDLFIQWESARKKMVSLGEGPVHRAMSVCTRRILFQAVRAMGAKSVLDIGTYVGTSAANFALAVGEGGSVVTVDVVDANGPNGYWKQDGRPHSPRELAEKVGGGSVEFVTQDGTEYLRQTDRTFDLICIDGGKGEDDTYEQLPLAAAHLNPNGIIFMDDFFPDGQPMPSGYYEPGHYLAVKRHMDEGAPIKFVYLSRTLDGSRIACAWVVRA